MTDLTRAGRSGGGMQFDQKGPADQLRHARGEVYLLEGRLNYQTMAVAETEAELAKWRTILTQLEDPA